MTKSRILRITQLIKALQNELAHHKTVTGYSYDEIADGTGLSRVALLAFAHAGADPRMSVSTIIAVESYLVAMSDAQVRMAKRVTHPLKHVIQAWHEGQQLVPDPDAVAAYGVEEEA